MPEKESTQLIITDQLRIPLSQIQIQAIRAQGAGGQNVNKVSSAVHLRFDINASTLPAEIKESMLALRDRRISSDGVAIIKAQRFRSQEKNRDDAFARLALLIRSAMVTRKARKATRPTRSSKRKRVDTKTRRGQLKTLRGRVET